MAQKRAKVGGEVAPNGEFYQGGRFINTIAENHKVHGSNNKAATRKQQWESYKWSVAPEGKTHAIFQLIGTQLSPDRSVTLPNGHYRVVVNTTPQVLAHFGDTAFGLPLQELADRFNAGERWV